MNVVRSPFGVGGFDTFGGLSRRSYPVLEQATLNAQSRPYLSLI